MMLNRFQPIVVAGLLPLLVFPWFTTTIAGQIDFWLLWLVAMVLVGLPLVFAEIGLAHRSNSTALVALPKLTRDADISTIWRGFGWLTILLLLIVIARLINNSVVILSPMFADVSAFAILGIMTLIVIAISFTKNISGLIAVACAMIAILINLTQSATPTWQITSISLQEWSMAIVLALISVGVATGLYWHSRANQLLIENQQDNKRLIASRYVLPIWGLQLLVGGFMAMATPPASSLVATLYVIAMLAGSAYLLQLVTNQISLRLHQQSFNFLLLVIMAVLGAGLSLVPEFLLNHLLVLLSFLSAVWLAIFIGWQMKISHVRKSLNFQSEAIYNLWRIAVRIIVPLAVILAVIGWGLSWLS